MVDLLKQEEKAIFALRKLYQSYGYSRFKMSKFESYDLYMQNKDFLISDSVITFTDKDGTLMALKPDVTLSIVKNFQKDRMPLHKVYYNESVYRVAGGTNHYREIMQTGLECLGNIGSYEIAEVILLAAKSLQAISPAFILDLSHLQIIADLIEKLNLSYDERDTALDAIGSKNGDALAAFPPLQMLTELSGPIEEVLPKLPALCRSEASVRAINQLQEISTILKENDLVNHVHIDFSIVNDMNYYNGIVFRGYIDGVPTSILSGGQYDKLMQKMEKDAGGIGFAVYLDQLERLNQRKKSIDIDVVLLYDNGDDIAHLSRTAGQLIAGGESVLLLQEIPDTLRYGRLIHYDNGRLNTDG